MQTKTIFTYIQTLSFMRTAYETMNIRQHCMELGTIGLSYFVIKNDECNKKNILLVYTFQNILFETLMKMHTNLYREIHY